MSHIMSGRAIAIKGRGGFTDFPVSIQYLGEPAPTEIMVNWLESRWQSVPYHLSYKTVLATFTAHG
ncbi:MULTISPECIES: hypothetical protein, partial [unclassified Microcoleus]